MQCIISVAIQIPFLAPTVGSTGVHAVSQEMTPQHSNYIGFSKHFEDEKCCISAPPGTIYITHIIISGSLALSPFATKVGGRFGQTRCSHSRCICSN